MRGFAEESQAECPFGGSFVGSLVIAVWEVSVFVGQPTDQNELLKCPQSFKLESGGEGWQSNAGTEDWHNEIECIAGNTNLNVS